MEKKVVYRFWGVMDLFLLGYYIVLNFTHYSPYYHVVSLLSGDGAISGSDKIDLFLIFISFVFYISIAVSMVKFFRIDDSVRKLAYVQIVFRLMFSVPSLSVVLVILRMIDSYSASSVFLLWIISEVVKVLSMRYVSKDKN